MSGRHNENTFTPLIFNLTQQQNFAKELKLEVNNYFKQHALKRTGGRQFVLKACVIASIYFAPYLLIVTETITNKSLLVLLAIMLGVGMATIGLVIMHDANHGCASSKAWVNKWLGYAINFLGGHAVNWKIQHNVLHHTFTNIKGYDEDIVSTAALRLTPNADWYWFHRYQHVYAPVFYSLLTLHWSGHSDFAQLKRYDKMGLLAPQKTTYKWEVLKLSVSKIGYFGFNIGVPLLLTNLKWWEVGLGFLIMHATAGVMLSLVFQSAHVTEMANFIEPKDNRIEENYLVHQLQTTRNFGTNSSWFTWLVGGLNHQIEHHLFPNISHVHYPGISSIVKTIAAKYAITYHQSLSFGEAICIHFSFLKRLGQSKNLC